MMSSWGGPLDVFVGRDVELEVLRRAFRDAMASRGGCVLIGGEPGIGKTRIAEAFAAEAREQGVHAVWGRCYEGPGAPAFWPWAQVIRALLRGLDAAFLRQALGSGAGDIAQIVPQLHEQLSIQPPSDALETAAARFRAFESIARFLERLARDTPLAIILDDLHGADEPSLRLLEFVRRELSDAAIVLIGCYRDAPLAPGHPLTDSIVELLRVPGTKHLTLHGLSPIEVGIFIERAAGAAPAPGLVEALYRRTEGNPLFIGEFLKARLVEGIGGRPLSSPSCDSFSIPASVKVAIEQRLAPLPAPCREALQVAAVIGREFQLPVLGAVLRSTCRRTEHRRRHESLRDLIQPALAMRLITEMPDGAERCRFAHVLIRETLYGSLTTPMRSELHRGVAEALESSDRAEENLAEMAHHRSQAHGPGDAAKALSYLSRAADRAMKMLAYEEAARLCEVGLTALDNAPEGDVARRCELLLILGSARKLAGQVSSAQATFLQLIDLARHERLPQELARGVLQYLWVNESTYASPNAVVLLEEALAALPAQDSALRAQLLGTLASQSLVTDTDERQAQGARLGRDALAMARRVGDAQTLARALRQWYFTGFHPDNLEERLVVSTELIELGEQTRDSGITLEGLTLRVPVHLERADRRAFDRDVADHALRAQSLRQPQWLWHVPLHSAGIAFFEGRFADAEHQGELLLQEGQRAEEPLALGLYWALLFNVRTVQGRLGEVPNLEGLLWELLARQPWNSSWQAGAACLMTELGRFDAGAAFVEEMIPGSLAGLARDSHYLTALACLSMACHDLHDSARAQLLYEALSPYAERNIVYHTVVPFQGPAHRYLGLNAAAMGQWNGAVGHFERALSMCKRMRAYAFTALVQYELAAALVARDEAGDHPHAVVLLEQSLSAARDMGLGMRLTQAEALLERCRVHDRDRAAITGTIVPLPSEPRNAEEFVFRRQGDYWTIVYGGTLLRMKNTKGLQYIAHLLRHPGQEFLALDLVAQVLGGRDHPPGNGGGRPGDFTSRTDEPRLDASAKAAYKSRLCDLRDELEDAERINDQGRAGRAREEIAAIARELATAVGLGGRDRTAPTDLERSRSAVGKRIRQALKSISEGNPSLGRHLSCCISTGYFCSYVPGVDLVSWLL
jgi:tetratricopeptide (TPR) repeat protein